MMASADHDSAAMAWNLWSDRRISPQRFASFRHTEAQLRPVVDDTTLRDALLHYWKHEINTRRPPAPGVPEREWPEFLQEAANGRNHHSGPSADRELSPLPHGSIELVRVMNLCKMGAVFDRARGAENSAFSECPPFERHPKIDPDAESPKTLLQWLDERLNGLAGADTRILRGQPFLQALLAWMNEDRRTHPFQPAWATYWESGAHDDPASPERWEEKLGVRADHERPRWLLLLRYTVRETRLLVRPTQLDAAWCPRHFPPPPDAGTAHPVDLGAAPPPAELLPEFIHEQIDHHPHHLVACARAEPPPDDEFVARRHRHLGRLRDKYTPGTGWPAYPLP